MTYESILEDVMTACPADWQKHILMKELSDGARCAYYLAGQPLFYVRFSPKVSRVEIDPGFVADLDGIASERKAMPSGLMALNIDLAFDHDEFMRAVNSAIEYGMKNAYAERFGCCNSFIECSDNLKCLHEGELEYMGCYYRENLLNGKVFYGKNSNV